MYLNHADDYLTDAREEPDIAASNNLALKAIANALIGIGIALEEIQEQYKNGRP